MTATTTALMLDPATDTHVIVRPERRWDGARGFYGCDRAMYELNGDFSCGARYYFGADAAALMPVPVSECDDGYPQDGSDRPAAEGTVCGVCSGDGIVPAPGEGEVTCRACLGSGAPRTGASR